MSIQQCSFLGSQPRLLTKCILKFLLAQSLLLAGFVDPVTVPVDPEHREGQQRLLAKKAHLETVVHDDQRLSVASPNRGIPKPSTDETEPIFARVRFIHLADLTGEVVACPSFRGRGIGAHFSS
jgi:hypothetical protein